MKLVLHSRQASKFRNSPYSGLHFNSAFTTLIQNLLSMQILIPQQKFPIAAVTNSNLVVSNITHLLSPVPQGRCPAWISALKSRHQQDCILLWRLQKTSISLPRGLMLSPPSSKPAPPQLTLPHTVRQPQPGKFLQCKQPCDQIGSTWITEISLRTSRSKVHVLRHIKR